MNPSLAIFVLVVVVAACQVQAQGNYNNDNYYGNSGMAPPAAYLAGSAPAAMAAAHQSVHQQADQIYQDAQQAAPRPHGGRLGAHLLDLGKVGLTSGRRVLADARPTLNNIRGDLGEYAQRVRQNPHVNKVYQVTAPRVKQAMAKAQPLVTGSQKRLSSMASNAQARMQARVASLRKQHSQQQQQQPDYSQSAAYEPASVYPNVPANAQY